MRDYHHLETCIDFTEVESGETLTKFVAVDKGEEGGDRAVEIHGFYDAGGKLYITNEIIRLVGVPADKSPSESLPDKPPQENTT